MFRMYLTIADHITPQNESMYDDELPLGVIIDACDLIEENNCAYFSVTGFTDLRWPVDVRFDLATILPELPSAVQNIKNGQDTNIDLFEQGIERSIRVHLVNGDALLSCTDLFGNVISSVTERMPVTELIDMLLKLMTDFITVATLCCPDINQNTAFQQWKKEIDQLH